MSWIESLPAINAGFNSVATVLLVTGFVLIRQKRVQQHRACMLAAFGTSCLFLAGYLTYHYFHGTTRFAETGLVRTVYFSILTTHTILAVVIVPLVLITLHRGLTARYDPHRRIARWTLPLWLYVSLTGVVVYFMLYRWYPPGG